MNADLKPCAATTVDPITASPFLRTVALAALLVTAIVSNPAGAVSPTEQQLYIVQLQDPPLASYRGGIHNLPPTSPAITGDRRFDPDRPASLAYRAHLIAAQDAVLQAVHGRLGRSVDPRFRYQVAFNGFAVSLDGFEAREVASLPGVLRVTPEEVQYPQTDVGPEWIGAAAAWGRGQRGEGIIVGILDTGLNLDHPSFADIGGDGYDHTNPWGPGSYTGLCQSDPGNWTCNDKLIGYWIYTGETTDDSNGHGSHVASTAAGNVLAAGTVDLTPSSYSPPISGVAPHANLIGYDVCDFGCPSSGTLAALDQAILDGVDVINYSIGGGSSDPWANAVAQAYLSVIEAGIVAVTSAGNSGPGSATLGSPRAARPTTASLATPSG